MFKQRSVFVIGNDPSVDYMFKAEGWDVLKDPNYADFLCFTGGADVSPDLYGEINHGLSHTDPERDTREAAIYNQFKGNKGLLGICRGGQFLNVMNGGKLRQDIPGHLAGFQVCRAVGANGQFRGTAISMKEDHHQEILPTQNARVFLKSIRDNVVEGCWYEPSQSFCFQPHPEWGHELTKNFFFAWIARFYDFK